MILSKKSKKNTTKLMVHLPHLKLIFIIQNCLSDMEKSLLKQSCLNITRKRGRQHYTNCIVFLLIWFFASSIFLKQKNKRNAVKSTFLSLKIMPQTGIEPEFRSANLEKQEGSAHLLLSVIKSVSKSALCFFKKLSRFPYLHFC